MSRELIAIDPRSCTASFSFPERGERRVAATPLASLSFRRRSASRLVSMIKSVKTPDFSCDSTGNCHFSSNLTASIQKNSLTKLQLSVLLSRISRSASVAAKGVERYLCVGFVFTGSPVKLLSRSFVSWLVVFFIRWGSLWTRTDARRLPFSSRPPFHSQLRFRLSFYSTALFFQFLSARLAGQGVS